MGAERRSLVRQPFDFGFLHFILMSNSDEHQRRSPDCVFFACLTAAKPKAGRLRKGRASKASRMSTQSNFTKVSEGVSVTDTDAHGDGSVASVVEPAKIAKSGKGAKKGAKAKKPAARSRKEGSKLVDENTQVASSFLEPEDADFEVKVDDTLKQSKGSKKRNSDNMSRTNVVSSLAEAQSHEEESQDQPRKRRATRIKGAVAQTRIVPTSPPQEEHDAQRTDAEDIPPPAPPQGRKKGKGGNKRSSSNARKASTASAASKAPLRAMIAPDNEIDAALEAELDRPLTDEDIDVEPPAMAKSNGRRLTRTKPGSRKATASVAPTRRTTRASTITLDDSPMQDIYPLLPEPEETHVPTPKKNEHAAIVQDSPEKLSPPKYQKEEEVPKSLGEENELSNEREEDEAFNDKIDEEIPAIEPQEPRSRQASRKPPTRKHQVSDIPDSFEAMDLASDINSSMLGTQTAQDDSGHETDASVVKQPRTKRGSRKAPAKKAKGGKKVAPKSRNIEDIVQPITDSAARKEQRTHTISESVSMDIDESKYQRTPSNAIAKSTETEKTLPESEASGREGSVTSLVDQPGTLVEAETVHPSVQPLSVHSTPRPALSPQSSDAENRPPSSSLPKPGPLSVMQSPYKSQTSRVPLAITTPISSPSRNSISKLQTTFPWTAVDLEHIFEGTPTAGKENSLFVLGDAEKRVKGLLTSPEKKMTVEQWIQSNAQRGEEKLRKECERLVGKFEDQGVRALRALEGIVCAERLR